MVAKWPDRVASLTMLSTTQCGWHMAAQMMKRPWVTLKVHPLPLTPLHDGLPPSRGQFGRGSGPEAQQREGPDHVAQGYQVPQGPACARHAGLATPMMRPYHLTMIQAERHEMTLNIEACTERRLALALWSPRSLQTCAPTSARSTSARRWMGAPVKRWASSDLRP